MTEVDVGPIKEGNLSGLQMDAEGRGTRVVVVTGFFDDGEAGEKTLQIEPEMKFGGGFATAPRMLPSQRR